MCNAMHASNPIVWHIAEEKKKEKKNRKKEERKKHDLQQPQRRVEFVHVCSLHVSIYLCMHVSVCLSVCLFEVQGEL